MTSNKEKVFITKKITNQDIYDKLVAIEETNGKVKLNRVMTYAIASVMFPAFSMVIWLLFNHISK